MITDLSVIRGLVYSRITFKPKRVIDLFDEITDSGDFVPIAVICAAIKQLVEKRLVKATRMLWRYNRNSKVWLA